MKCLGRASELVRIGFIPGPSSLSLHLPVISTHAPRHALGAADADPVSKERVTVSSSPNFIVNLPCPFSDPQCIDE
jgi:hypothetical protein